MSITTSTVPADDLSDEDLMQEPIPVRMLAMCLRLYADHKGRESATPWRIKNAIFPANHEITHDVIETMLLRLTQIRWLAIYDVDGRTYLQIRNVGGQSHANRPSQFPPAPTGAFTTTPPRPDPPRTDSGLWGERASAGERASQSEPSWASDPNQPTDLQRLMETAPPLFCEDHAPYGTPEPCVACKDYRRARDDWELRVGIRKLPTPTPDPEHQD